MGHTPTSTTVSAWRRNCAPNCSLSPKWEPNASSPTHEISGERWKWLIFLCTYNGKIGYRWLLSQSCNISGGWDGRSVRIISSSLHVNCNDCTMTNHCWWWIVFNLSGFSVIAIWLFTNETALVADSYTVNHSLREREGLLFIRCSFLFCSLRGPQLSQMSKYTNPFLSFFQFSSETWIYFSFFAIF